VGGALTTRCLTNRITYYAGKNREDPLSEKLVIGEEFPDSSQTSGRSFRLGGNEELGGGVVVLDPEQVLLAANLAVFDVTLASSRGLVDDGFVPFAAECALEARFHIDVRPRHPEKGTTAPIMTHHIFPVQILGSRGRIS
jgi:hypothetical protein